MRRLPIVGVLGSGTESHEPLSAELGRWLAREDVHLLTGGGGGVMAAVSRRYRGDRITTIDRPGRSAP